MHTAHRLRPRMVGGTRLTKSHRIAAKAVIRVLAQVGGVARVHRGAVTPIDRAVLVGAERLAWVEATCPLREILPTKHS